MDFEKYCKNCKRDAHCCIFEKGGFVFTTPKNAKKIATKINKNYDYFLDYSPLNKKIVNSIKNCDPVLEDWMRYSQLDKKNRILRLKIKKDGNCIFLNNRGKCEIYDIRPNICRIFPFWAIRLTNGKLKVIVHDIDSNCSAIRIFAKSYENIEQLLSKSELTKIIKLFKNIEQEADSYNKQVKR